MLVDDAEGEGEDAGKLDTSDVVGSLEIGLA
jgi:hypothetical protein